MSTYLPVLPQLSAHDPCGHWHKRHPDHLEDDAGFDTPACCWDITCAVSSSQALLVFGALHIPWQLMFLVYNIATNKWDKIHYEDDVFRYTAFDPMGAAIHGSVCAFHNYTYLGHGTAWYNEYHDDPMARTVVSSPGALNSKFWPGTSDLSGRARVACHTSGVVMVIVKSGAWNVEVSTNFGATYTTRMTLPLHVDRTDVVCAINEDGHLFVSTLNKTAATMTTYRSIDQGVNWTTMSTRAVITAPQAMELSCDADKLFACVQGGTTTRFYYSSNDGNTWSEAVLEEPSIHYAASGSMLYNLTQLRDFRTDDYTAPTIAWEPLFGLPVDKTVAFGCTLRNSGGNCVYTQSDMRVRIGEASIISILVSLDIGTKWREIQTPIRYHATMEEAIERGADNPVWLFTPQEDKM